MKSVAKLITFLILMLMLVTVVIEVIVFYVNQAEIVAISGFVLETSTELANEGLEDVETEVELKSDGDTAIYAGGLYDNLKFLSDQYYSSPEQSVSFNLVGPSTLNLPSKGINEGYDQHLNYVYVGEPTSGTKIQSLDIYVNVIDELDGSKRVDMRIHAKLFFYSGLLRRLPLADKLSGDIVYKDSVNYSVVKY